MRDQLTLFDGDPRMARSADISDCQHYRWWLKRLWPVPVANRGSSVCFVMLNPSTADGQKDDPTVLRCIGFAKRWGFESLIVRNLFPYRATDPIELLTAVDPCGGERGDQELAAATNADVVVCAWGAKVPFGRDKRAMELLGVKRLFCLGLTKDGHPRHPLYVPASTRPQLFF